MDEQVPQYHAPRNDKPSHVSGVVPESGTTRRRKLIGLLVGLLEEIDFTGADSKGRWTFKWHEISSVRWVLTKGQVRAWLECNWPHAVPQQLVDSVHNYLQTLAEVAEAEADAARFCAVERAVDTMAGLRDREAAAGGAR